MKVVLADRYRIETDYKEEKNRAKLLGLSIKTYSCFDEHAGQKVIIKAVPLPDDPHIQDLAINIWEQDIRLIRKANSMVNGIGLLKLLDARMDETNKLLITVFEHYIDTLESLISKKSDSSIFSRTTSSRKQFWDMILPVVQGIDSLHQAGILIRNINPRTLFFVDDNETPLRIGDFNWSVYLHSLIQVLNRNEKLTLKDRIWDLYCAPEIIPGDKKKKFGESFSSDLFSLGMVIARCLLDTFPDNAPKSLEERYAIIFEIKDELRDSNVFLLEEEKQLVLNLIEISPSSRLSSTRKVIEQITEIISKLTKSDDFDITAKIPVSFDSRRNSYFWKTLSRLVDQSPAEIASNLPAFLDEELKGALIYPTGDETFPLCTVTSSNICVEFCPKFSTQRGKENLYVAVLKIPHYHFQKKFLKAIRTAEPIACLKEGVYQTDRPYDVVHESRWPRLFMKARAVMAEKTLHQSEEVARFIERLLLILDAQKELDSKYIFKYKRISRSLKNLETKEEGVTVNLLDVDQSTSILKKEGLQSFVREVNEKSQGRVELSVESSPYAKFDHDRIWEITSYNTGKKEITFRRKARKNNKGVPERGYIRPHELSLGVDLHRRKYFGIVDLKDNTSLSDILIFPESVLYCLGLPTKHEELLVNKIHDTIPMFLVQGPPGTGKTWLASTIVETIISKEPSTRILLSAHDHHPLDNLLEAVVDKLTRENFVSTPTPLIMRLLSADKEQQYEEDAVAFHYSPHNVTTEILRKTNQEIDRGKVTLDEDLLKLWKEELEKNIESPSFDWVRLIRRCSNIVFSTATSRDLRYLDRYAPPFDWVIIEEAGKAYITELILPMNLGQRWLLIGDQRQLPPFKHREIKQVLNHLLENESEMEAVEREEVKELLIKETKYFDDLYNRFGKASIFHSRDVGNKARERLQKQWRMPPKISDMISTIFYDDTLFEHRKERSKDNVPFKSPQLIAKNELIWINTPYCTVNHDAEETFLPHGGHRNNYEVKVIGKFLESLVPQKMGENQDIVIISPYKDQVKSLESSLKTLKTKFQSDGVSSICHTIDSYQGREADVVIISLVRNNTKEEVTGALGFIIEEERLNVLFSRVKNRLIVVGCIEQFEIFKEESRVEKMIKVIQYFKDCGKIVKSNSILEGSFE